jgi:hypothetical protein
MVVLLLLFAALVLFVAAAVIQHGRLIPAGLACWVAAEFVNHYTTWP